MHVFLLLLMLNTASGDAVLSGKAEDAAGEAVHHGSALLVELKRSVKIGDDGSFRFEKVPAGTWNLQVTSRDHGTKLQRVVLKAGETTRVTVEFDLTVHEYLTISAAPTRKSISDVSQAVGVINEDELMVLMQPSLGETLSSQPGVSSSYFGPGSSRPIIRGLGGDRIRILEAGVDTGDVASTSADHAVSIDTATADRVEVLRGPASLRYGSSAVGGVVNVLDNRIPETVPGVPLEGQLELRGDTAADKRATSIRLNGGTGSFAWHADFSTLETDDVEIPASPEEEHGEEEHGEEEEGEEHEEEPFNGVLENSAIDSDKGSVGVSYVTDRGFIGLSVVDYNTFYGISGHGHHGHDEEEEHEEGEHEEEEEGEEEVNIDLEQRRYDLRGELRLDGPFDTLNFRIGANDYEHVELEGEEIGTTFTNEYQEIRVEATHGAFGAMTSGSVGVQYSQRDFQAIGEEAFVPANDTDRLAAFIYEEMERDTWSLTMGLRVERQNNKAEAFDPHHHEEEGEEHEEEGEEHEEEAQPFDLDFDGISASLGYIYGLDKDYAVAVNLTHTERAPNAEELFSNGPHLATAAFEVGNPDMDKESSLGLDVVLRKKAGLITGELSLFTNQFSDYIYEQFTGEEEDGLREFEYVQADADFTGGEFHADITLLHTEPHHLHAEFSYDFVRGELDA
ncbi:MAG: TonB-dependent receptor, partial [Acidobacteriota bacterium]|nr:TonB-dependent receptor [Acidobacteriota bacterium]